MTEILIFVFLYYSLELNVEYIMSELSVRMSLEPIVERTLCPIFARDNIEP